MTDAPVSVGVELVRQLPAILAALGAIISAIIGFVAMRRTAAIETKTDHVTTLVNSEFQKAQRKIQAGLDEIAALKREIATRNGATTEERVRADVATEQQGRGQPLPGEGRP
jgi:Skp family chaperone for outer membrane proteins